MPGIKFLRAVLSPRTPSLFRAAPFAPTDAIGTQTGGRGGGQSKTSDTVNKGRQTYLAKSQGNKGGCTAQFSEDKVTAVERRENSKQYVHITHFMLWSFKKSRIYNPTTGFKCILCMKMNGLVGKTSIQHVWNRNAEWSIFKCKEELGLIWRDKTLMTCKRVSHCGEGGNLYCRLLTILMVNDTKLPALM